MEKSVVQIGSFIHTNWGAMLKAESSVSRFKDKHRKFVAAMLAKDFASLMHGATVEQLEKGFNGWIDKNVSHIATNSGGILASYDANKEAILDFQTDLKRAELLKMSKGTEGMVSDKETAALDKALVTYRNEALPYIIKESAAKLMLVMPDKAARTKVLKEQLSVITDNEAEAVKALEEAK